MTRNTFSNKTTHRATNQSGQLRGSEKTKYPCTIENLWRILKKNIARHKTKNKNELKSRILEEWEKISPAVCYKLVATMPKRIQLVIKCRGGAIKY